MYTKEELIYKARIYLNGKIYKGLTIPKSLTLFDVVDSLVTLVKPKVISINTNINELFEQNLQNSFVIAYRKKESEAFNKGKVIPTEWSVPSPSSLSRFLPSVELNDSYGRTYSDTQFKLTYWLSNNDNPITVKQNYNLYSWFNHNVIIPITNHYSLDTTKTKCIQTYFKINKVDGCVFEFSSLDKNIILDDLFNDRISGIIYGICYPTDDGLFFSTPISGIPPIIKLVLRGGIYGLSF